MDLNALDFSIFGFACFFAGRRGGGGRVEGFRASISKQNGILLRRVYILQEDFRFEFRVLGFGYLDSPVKPQLLKYHLFVSFRV